MGKLVIIAENRSDAPAQFVIDVFKKEPSWIVVKAQDDPGFLYRGMPQGETRPGFGLKIETELNFHPSRNERGPELWFRMPEELQGKFYMHEVSWDGESLLRRPGFFGTTPLYDLEAFRKGH